MDRKITKELTHKEWHIIEMALEDLKQSNEEIREVFKRDDDELEVLTNLIEYIGE